MKDSKKQMNQTSINLKFGKFRFSNSFFNILKKISHYPVCSNSVVLNQNKGIYRYPEYNSVKCGKQNKENTGIQIAFDLLSLVFRQCSE